MKKILYSLFICGLLAGCTTNMDMNNTPVNSGEAKVFTASLAPATTKTYADEDLKLYWTEGDMLSIFASTLNEKYAFNGNTGDNSATFSKVHTGFGYGNALERNYAVYPYSSLSKISNEGVLSITLPAKQDYAEQSFGVNANTMVAATENLDDTFLALKSVGGFLKLRLYGEGVTVKRVRLEGNNSEKIAGAATVVAEYGVEPEVTMEVDATGIITLNCDEGVALGNANEVKDFWIVIPPTVFEGGFTVTVVDTNNMAFKQVSEKKQEVVRNTILAMPPVEVVPTEPDTYEEEPTPAVQPNNEIWYTSVDDCHVVPNVNENTFGANIEDFLYENGKGIIRFDGPVTHIGDYAFDEANALLTISLPESVTRIGIDALCSNSLESVTLPTGLLAIDQEAFYGCRSLKTISIPESVTHIGRACFANCGFEEIVIPSGIKYLKDELFYGCSNLKKVTLPEGVISIASWCFHSCSSLSTINIPDSVLDIQYGAFSNTAISEIICPPKVSYIAENAFEECANLTTVVVPEHIKKINRYAFQGCENLTKITIPASVKHIDVGVFQNCSSLTELAIPDGTTMSFAEYYISEDGGYEESYEVRPFEGCSSLEKVSLGSGITEVCERMFYGLSNLTEVTLSANVETIGSSAFVSCSSLAKVTCLATVPPTVSGTMFSSNYIPYIHVPAESVAQYKGASGWSTYADYILAEGEEPGTGDTTTLSDILNNYTNSGTLTSDICNVKELTVVATHAKGFVAQEEGFYVYIYNPTIIPAIGSVINISGTVSLRNSILQFNNGAIVTETGAVNVVDNSLVAFEFGTDMPLDYYVDILSLYGTPCPYLASYTGTLTQNGNYYNVVADGATIVQGSITSPTDEMKATLNELVGSQVKVTGYLLGIGTSGGTKYAQTMVVSVEAIGPSQL